jgi:hypothetical protein
MACCCAAKAGPAETINAQDDALKKEVSKAVQEAQAMLAPVEPTIGDDGKKFGFVTPQREFECQIGVHGQKLGIDINYHDGATVLITKINEGPIHEYNKKGPEELLLVGDRFTKVNDVEGEVKMLLEAVKKEDIMVCTVRRAYERTIHLMRREDGQEHGIQVEKFDEMSVFHARRQFGIADHPTLAHRLSTCCLPGNFRITTMVPTLKISTIKI